MSSPSRFTEKLQEALGRAQNAALSAHHQAVDVEHLLAALLEDDEGLASSMLKLARSRPRRACGASWPTNWRRFRTSPAAAPTAGQVYVTQRLGRVLARAEQEAGKLKDEYVSIEHVLIAMLDEPGAASRNPARGRPHARQADGRAAEGARQSARHLVAIPKRPTRRSSTTGATSPSWRRRARSIRSSAATRRSAASSRCCRGAPRTTRC